MPGLTQDGFERKTLEQIVADLVARERANIDSALDTSDLSLPGQFNAIFGSAVAELWEVIQQVHDAHDPAMAEGAALEAICALSGTTRSPATRSTVPVSLTLADGTTVLAGSVVSVTGSPAARFLITETIGPVAGDGVYPASAEAEATGPVVANTGTLTVIETPVSGWSAVTNPADAEVGSDVENDEQLRARRERELAAAGGGTLLGIAADVSGLDDVQQVSPLENDTDVPGELPPHSFQMIVSGGVAAEIAASILANKAAGIRSHGDVVTSVLGSDGQLHVVRFSRPTSVRVYMAARVVAGAGYPGAAVIRDAIRAAAETPGSQAFLRAGRPIYASKLVCPAVELAGVDDVQLGLSLTAITDPDDGEPVLEVGPTEIGAIDTGDIWIEEV